MRTAMIARNRMSACRTAGIVLGVLALIGVAANVPDIVRYIRLKTM